MFNNTIHRTAKNIRVIKLLDYEVNGKGDYSIVWTIPVTTVSGTHVHFDTAFDDEANAAIVVGTAETVTRKVGGQLIVS